MKKYTLSNLFLILLILNINMPVTASDADKLEGSLMRSTNHTLGPNLNDVPCICTLELQMQEPFRTSKFNVVPKTFKNTNQSYELNKRFLAEECEEKAKQYLIKEREKQDKWRTKQNELRELKTYDCSRPLESGERDTLQGARRPSLALDWLEAQTYELKIMIRRVEKLLALIEREKAVKGQIIEEYEKAQSINKEKSYLSVTSYFLAWYNYNFDERICQALSTIYEFRYRSPLEDDHSSEAQTKRKGFVTAIPMAHTPKTLPKRQQSPKESSKQPSASVEKNDYEAEWQQFLGKEQEENPLFYISLQEFIAYKTLVQQTQLMDQNFSMNYQEYKAFCELLEREKQSIVPQDFKIYMVKKKRIQNFELSYQDYHMRLKLWEKLPDQCRKILQFMKDTSDFTSLKERFYALLEQYQGEPQRQADNTVVVGGLLGRYIELHKEIEGLDKKLITYNLINFSLYELKKYEKHLRPLFLTTEMVIKKPFYVVGDNFKDWQEVGMLDELVIPIEQRCVIWETARRKRQEKKQEDSKTEEPKVIQAKKEVKKRSREKPSEASIALPQNFVERVIKFITQCYTEFNKEVFLLGLTPDQAEFLHKRLEDKKQNSLFHAIKKLRSAQVRGREWILPLAPIRVIDLSGQRLELPGIAPREDESVKRRIEARFKVYQEELSDYQQKISEIEKELTAQRTKIKTLRDVQGTAVGTLVLVSKTSSNELETLQTSLNSEINNSADLDREQLSIVDILSRFFGGDEVLPLSRDAIDDEATSPLNRIIKEAKKLKLELEMRERKENDTGKKQELNLVSSLLENVSIVIGDLQQVEAKQEEKKRFQKDISDKSWVLDFYAHLQAMPCQPQQRIKISFQPIQDVNQVEQNEVRVVHLMHAAYRAFFTDIFEQEPLKDVSISQYKLNDKELGIIIDLEDLQPPIVKSLMLEKA